MKVQHIIGADLSKKTIDVFCHSLKRHRRIENNETGFKLLIQWLNEGNIDISQTGIIMEHTGYYSSLFEKFLQRHSIAFVKVPALEILRSQGMVRGKSDKIDAERIASYGFEKQQTLIPTKIAEQDLVRLKMLNSVRSGLVSEKTGLKCRIKEYQNIGIKETDLIIKSQQKILVMLEKQIRELEAETAKIIKSNDCIRRNYNYLLSVRGIGPVTATVTIIKTGNFTLFTDGRKFSCYCGTAPFEYSSGSSVRGKTRVSYLGDKEMKTLLDLAAKSAIQHDPELKGYYRRRTGEGKSKMSTINIVRNKLINRMFAVIKRQSPFVDGFVRAA